MRKLIIGAIAVAAILLVAAAVTFAYFRSSVQRADGELELHGLAAPVHVYSDGLGVPQVFAGSMNDAVFAQGYLHARDRLWQMEVVRRAVQGRLSEVLGEEALGTDRFMRTLRLWEATALAERAMTPKERELLDAYSAGVNAAIGAWDGAMPPEFVVLGFEPEPWTPRHSLAVGKLMSFTLSAYDEAVDVAEAMRAIGPEKVRFLVPGAFEWGRVIMPPPVEPVPPLARALVDGVSIAAASNSWVVAADRSRSGKPLLANDPHLGLQAPSLWYLVGLHAAGERPLDVVGASIPGTPLVILGHNRAIAWGMTNAYVDDIDLIIERRDPADPERYLVPGGSEPFEVVAETIQVKGREAPEVLTVRRTRHGPVVSARGWEGDEVLAARWTALEPSTVFRAVAGFNLASGWDEFVAALRDMDDPHQNLVYADTAGHIGYWMGGTVSIRGDRRPPPIAPVPGWTGEWDWTGTLPFEEHPHVLDPAAGYVATANNPQAAGEAASLISQSWMLPFRAMRIADMIEARETHDVGSMHAMQMDLLDLQAVRSLGNAVEAARAAGQDDAATMLESWDGRASADSEAAGLFYHWYGALRDAASRDLFGAAPGFLRYPAVAAVLDERALGWRADGAAVYRQLAADAMDTAVARAAGRPWGEINRVLHGHSLGSVELLDRLLGLNVGPAPLYGSPNTVNVAHHSRTDPGSGDTFTTTSGVSMRHVVDMGNLDSAGGFVIGTGQSGNPLSRHYHDQLEMWREGGLHVLPLSRDAIEERAANTLILRPDPEG